MNKKEKTKIIEIISEFSVCHSKIIELEGDIENLLKRKNELLSNLRAIRQKEKDTIKVLQEKYGDEAILDLQNMEIRNEKA